MRELKDVIKELRQKHGNKTQVAEKLGISPQLLGQYERGRQKPKIDFFEAWEKAYHEDIRAIQKEGSDETNVPHETKNHTSVDKRSDNKENPDEPWEVQAFRKIIEGDAEYILVSRAAFEGSHRFTSVEQVNAQTEQIRMLTKAFIDFVKESKGLGSISQLPKIEETQKDTGV